MINEQKIRLFLSLAETLSFTETANRLFITQQAVSKHISQLEADLGFPLFIRSTHKVQLTPAGERCRVFFSEELEKMTAFIRDEMDEYKRKSKSLRIGYNNWINYGSPIVSARVRFSRLYPDIAHIPETQAPDILLKKLRDRELDLIVIIKRFIQNEAGLSITDLMQLPMSVLIKKDPARKDRLPDRKELSEMPVWINSFLGETAADTKARAKRELKLLDLSNREIHVTSNRDSVYIAVETGEGITISCMLAQTPSGIMPIPFEQKDTLAAVSLESNRRKLVKTYNQFLLEEYNNQEE